MDSTSTSMGFKGKMNNYMVFTTFRLSALVIVSALSGYLFVGGSNWSELTYLLVGGLLITY